MSLGLSLRLLTPCRVPDCLSIDVRVDVDVDVVVDVLEDSKYRVLISSVVAGGSAR